MELRLLGPLELRVRDRRIELGGARAQKLLAALALEPDRTVPLGRLIDVLWDDDPPATAVRQVQNTAAAVRRLIGRADVLITDGPGYRLRTNSLTLDTRTFTDQLALATDAAAAGHLDRAVEAMRAGLELWRGNALTGIRSRILRSAAIRLDERRLEILEECLELELRLGRHRGLTGELAALVTEHPLHERFTAQLMLTLYRNGRVGEALDAYRRLRTRLGTELGVDAGPEVRGLQSAILRADSALNQPAELPLTTGTTTAVPRQLPSDPAAFTGRVGPLTELESLLPHANGAAARVVVIDGPAGTGKTMLAVHFAHRVAERFPDGQIFINLRGFDPDQDPVPPGTALGRLLRALGVDPARTPSDLDEQAALYRTLLAGRRVLIVLDNASGAEQVRPLLAGCPTSLVVITSRNRLPGLAVRQGAHRIGLGVLTAVEAMDLLCRTIGSHRVRAEPGAAAGLAELAGRLPLALRIVAERANARPHAALSTITADLRAEHDRLDTGDARAGALRAVLSHSYRALDGPAARIFRLLGLNPSQDIGLGAAAAIAGRSISDTRRRLDQLVAASLLAEPADGRYTWHDLIRADAAERSRTVDSPAERHEASHRLLDFYLHTAARARLHLRRLDAHLPLDAALPGVRPLNFTSQRQAVDWCEAERDNLVAAVRFAASNGFDAHAWKLSCVLGKFFHLRKHRADWVATHETGLAAARRLGDRFGEGRVLNGLACAHGDQGRYQTALGYFARLLEIVTQTGDRHGEAVALHNVGVAHRIQGRYGAALNYFHQVLAIEREIGERDGEGMVLANIGECCRNLGRYEDALDHYRTALAIHRAGGESRGEARALHGIGDCKRDLGRFAEAVTHYRGALALRRAHRDQCGTASTMTNLGQALRGSGNLSGARTYWEQAQTLFAAIGDPRAHQLHRQLSPWP